MSNLRSQNNVCPSEEISSYIDGELNFEQEMELDAHFANCVICTDELNRQKQFLCGLESGLKNETDLILPANFAKRIVANAEANVSGVRRPAEFFNAIFVCVAILLFVLFASGAEAGNVLKGGYLFVDQIMAVGGVFGHFVYDLSLGVAIVIRSFATQFRADVVITVLLSVVLAAPTIFLSRRVLRVGRA